MVSKKILAIVISLVIIIMFLSLLLITKYHKATETTVTTSSTATTNTSSQTIAYGYVFYELLGSNVNFNLIGNHLSDAAYSMGSYQAQSGITMLASPYLWNLKSGNGNAVLQFQGNTLNVSVNFTDFVKINDTINVGGYPGLMYGQELWFPFATTSGLLPQLKLPMLVNQLPTFVSRTNYTLTKQAGFIQDFSYDIWFTTDPTTTYLQYPDIEWMIWLYAEQNLAGKKYFVNTGTVSVDALVNGTKTTLDFDVYVLPHTGSSDGWIGVYYQPQNPIMQGDVILPLSAMIPDVFAAINKVFSGGIYIGDYYLNGIQIGMEFNTVANGVTVGYTLNNWSFGFPTSGSTSLKTKTNLRELSTTQTNSFLPLIRPHLKG